jgi:Protein of unknown function (DUF3307)
MENNWIWLLKLILSHLLTDFVLQPSTWVLDRNKKHFGSKWLYLHGIITAALAYVMIGWQYWGIALVILVSHILIDCWKSYRQQNLFYFSIDQVAHFIVIGACFYFSFLKPEDLFAFWDKYAHSLHVWKLVLGIVFLTLPAGILIGLLTRQWREKINDVNLLSLSNAGKWIGVIERIIVLIMVLNDQYAAIGLLVAAKSIVRFSEKDRQEIKTEYLVIGTLLSIGVAMITGLIVKN